MAEMFIPSKNSRLNKGLLVAALIFSSWLFPPTRLIWNFVDYRVFSILNGSLANWPGAQTFWALMNYKFGHSFPSTNLALAPLAALFFCDLLKQNQGSGAKAFGCLGVIILLIVITLFINKQVLHPFMQHVLDFTRDSPTLVVENPIRLSLVFPDLNIRDQSHQSFPGDNSIMWISWAGFMLLYSTRPFVWIQVLAAAFLCTPRLFSGGHWLSDIIVGGGSVSLGTPGMGMN
ncbi:phosphatase PAP2 family protein [Endozoicomonas sp. SCSIO W0465]|uniref:phosphatase PAP2 family protein n=1 Tax=Endozoicomonas sp. SCSIO W0465 TaxID=2918516 RepID=UPI0020758490|nr:phosphatase PAP2 family protein [Endozoicomonas sp. SCSIO W0465]USE37135.1 phosphatase PAP2 family protein [Endozoicomonas sp. SCSIO W0465]